METVKLEVGVSPKVEIETIGGDLRLSGREDTQLEAQAPERGRLEVDEDGEHIHVKCRSDCLIFLPAGARVEVTQVGGDTRATGLESDLMIKTVGGDLSLRRVGRSTVELIGGDLYARKVGGDLTVDRVGGDAVAEKVSGDVRLRAVGGDLVVHVVDGLVEASTGGDASLAFTPKAETRSVLRSGGDLLCRLPEDVSAMVALQAGGDVSYPSDLEADSSDERTTLRMGEAEAAVDLIAGGDVWLSVGKGPMDFSEDMVGSVMGEMSARLADMEARFNAMGAGMYAFDAERIGDRVRRSVERARRKAERARQKAAKAQAGAAKRRSGHEGKRMVAFGMLKPEEPEVVEEERLAVLRMLENGVISVDEAEKLLKTLGGEV